MECQTITTVPEVNKILVIVGPSGVGKDTLMKKVLDKYPGKFNKAVTYTSRKMRPGEKEGYNYYYATQEEFLKLKDEDRLVEHFFYSGNYYGLSKKELKDGTKGDKILYLNIGISGAKKVHELNIPANFVAILPPSEETLEKRLKGRGTESEEVIKERLEIAKTETREIDKSSFFNCKVYNDDLDIAIIEMEEKLKNLYPRNFNL